MCRRAGKSPRYGAAAGRGYECQTESVLAREDRLNQGVDHKAHHNA
jgi:hypothetical protein